MKMDLSVQDIKELMATMDQYAMSKLTINQGDFTLELKGRRVQQVAAPAVAASAPVYAAPEAEAPAQLSGNVVTSPIVGTFYAAPAPDQPPYVKVGDRVKKGDVLFIIESMKLMNEVLSEHDGTVAEILVGNEQAVEFGQPILRIE